MTSIWHAKTKEEYLEALQDEQDDKEWEEIIRMSKSVHLNVRTMARVFAYHKFGYGDCPCNNCSKG